MVKALVTGGAGFIGSHVVDNLISKGHQVIVLDDLSGGDIRNVNPKAKFIKGSILNTKLINECTKGVDVIYHLAAYAAEGLSTFIRKFNHVNNVVGSVNLINAAINNNVKMFVFTSSLAVYGSGKPPFDEKDTPKPEDSYGVAKYSVEMELEIAHKQHGLNYVIFRPHNVYGERQFLGDPYRNVLGIWMNRIMQGKEPLIFGDGEQTRAFTYVGDIAPCIVESAFNERAKNQIINIGSGKHYSVKQLAEVTVKSMKTDLVPTHLPPRHEVKHAHCTTAKSEDILGFKDKTPLEVGVKRMADWAKTLGPCQPIVWEGYEVTKNMPGFYINLKEEYPKSSFRMDTDEAIRELSSNQINEEAKKVLNEWNKNL